jgi:hypothetical protein
MTRWGWVLLIFELFLFVVILIHPDVDLPDTAFRDGNSPVLAKLQVTTAPVMAVSITRISTGFLHHMEAAVQKDLPFSERTSPATLRSLICTMLC